MNSCLQNNSLRRIGDRLLVKIIKETIKYFFRTQTNRITYQYWNQIQRVLDTEKVWQFYSLKEDVA